MRVLRLTGAALVVVGCGGGGDGGGGPGPQTPVASVVVTSSAQTANLCGTVTLTAQPRDAQSNPLSRTISWNSSNSAAIALSATSGSSITATGIGVGSSNVTATSEGVTSNPAVTIAVTAGGQAPATEQVAATTGNQFNPACVRISAGGSVTWSFAATHNVIFDAPKPTTDVPDQGTGTATRTFPTAGSFRYICNLHPGMIGRVIVQ